jgi:hypothetical protein
MDTDTLVDSMTGSGWRLIDALERAGFGVKAAAWVRTAEDQRWSLYIVSKDLEGKGLIAGYRALADVLRQMAAPQLSVSTVKLVGEGTRAARDLLEAQSVQPAGWPQRAPLTSVGGEPVEEVYVYPTAKPTTIGPKQTVLRFVLRSADDPMAVMSRLLPQGKAVLNRTSWRGKEPRSCGITSIKGRPRAVGSQAPAAYDVEVTCRPKGCITYVSGTRYDGWTMSVLDRAENGTLFDGKGHPLPEGHPPVYRQFEVYDDVDFNELDFGEFVGEFDVEGIKHVSFEHVMERIRHSDRISGSLKASFVAPRRHRPVVKIVLSNNATGVGVDEFGTHIFNIQKSIPQLQQAILDHVSETVNGFIEGRYSLKNLSNGDFVFAELDDLLVDCAPTEERKKSRFNCLREYLPDSYLDELAMRLVATYEVDVSVVDGPKIGLLLVPLCPTPDRS